MKMFVETAEAEQVEILNDPKDSFQILADHGLPDPRNANCLTCQHKRRLPGEKNKIACGFENEPRHRMAAALFTPTVKLFGVHVRIVGIYQKDHEIGFSGWPLSYDPEIIKWCLPGSLEHFKKREDDFSEDWCKKTNLEVQEFGVITSKRQTRKCGRTEPPKKFWWEILPEPPEDKRNPIDENGMVKTVFGRMKLK